MGTSFSPGFSLQALKKTLASFCQIYSIVAGGLGVIS